MFKIVKFSFEIRVGSVLFEFGVQAIILCTRRWISTMTQGCPSLGLHNFDGTYFSVNLFRDPLNSFHLIFVSQFRVFFRVGLLIVSHIFTETIPGGVLYSLMCLCFCFLRPGLIFSS